jgi:hypothetical protein
VVLLVFLQVLLACVEVLLELPELQLGLHEGCSRLFRVVTPIYCQKFGIF